MPDICGKLETPLEKSQVRFVSWYDRYLLKKYQAPVGPAKAVTTFLSGNDCYALRCAFLHQGEFDIQDQRARKALERFHITAPRHGWVVHMNMVNGQALQLQVDKLCLDICAAVEEWLSTVAHDADIQGRMDLLGAIS